MDQNTNNQNTKLSVQEAVKVVRRVLEQGMDVSQALRAEGLTDDPKVGADVGAIGLLSRGRLVRKDYTQQAVTAALLPWYSDLG